MNNPLAAATPVNYVAVNFSWFGPFADHVRETFKTREEAWTRVQELMAERSSAPHKVGLPDGCLPSLNVVTFYTNGDIATARFRAHEDASPFIKYQGRWAVETARTTAARRAHPAYASF